MGRSSIYLSVSPPWLTPSRSPDVSPRPLEPASSPASLLVGESHMLACFLLLLLLHKVKHPGGKRAAGLVLRVARKEWQNGCRGLCSLRFRGRRGSLGGFSVSHGTAVEPNNTIFLFGV